MESQVKKLSKEEILERINTNVDDPDFISFASSMMDEWDKKAQQKRVIDEVIVIICGRWNITRLELIQHKKYFEPRNLLFYVLKKGMGMSYGNIAGRFLKQKSHVHKYCIEMDFMVNKKQKKELVEAIDFIFKNVAFP